MTQFLTFRTRGLLMATMALGLAGCENGADISRLNPFQGGPSATEAALKPALPRPDPDARGVITYNSYQVMVAREGDSVAVMAERVGLTPKELADHNGLPVTYRPRTGEVLALPRNVGGSPADNVWSPDIVSSAIDAAPLGSPTGNVPFDPSNPALATTGTANPFQNGQPSPVIDPIRHRVEPGETAFSIARLYGVSVTALSSWNGLDSELRIRENQELLIPLVSQANVLPAAVEQPPAETQVAAVERPATTTDALPLPPSASQPLPANEEVAAVEVPASPNLGQFRTPPGGKLRRPVSGNVIRPFSPGAGADKNEGIDIAAAAGTPVSAAKDGEVALISNSLGGLGTIVLVRHADDLITVYGRVTGVTLKKGDKVSTGQKIGVIADGDQPNLHFEVRRGTEAVDPAPYL